jgi:hypothetical protein
MTGIELQFKDKIISALSVDNRIISIIVTLKQDNVEINFGGMDFIPEKMPVSKNWLNSQLILGSEINILIKNFDDTFTCPQSNDHIFEPYKETDEEKLRRYHSLKKRLENLEVL